MKYLHLIRHLGDDLDYEAVENLEADGWVLIDIINGTGHEAWVFQRKEVIPDLHWVRWWVE